MPFLDPAGLYELCNEGFINSFKIACAVIIDDEFKLDAKIFAVEGEKLQKLYGFLNPEIGKFNFQFKISPIEGSNIKVYRAFSNLLS